MTSLGPPQLEIYFNLKTYSYFCYITNGASEKLKIKSLIINHCPFVFQVICVSKSDGKICFISCGNELGHLHHLSHVLTSDNWFTDPVISCVGDDFTMLKWAVFPKPEEFRKRIVVSTVFLIDSFWILL